VPACACLALLPSAQPGQQLLVAELHRLISADLSMIQTSDTMRVNVRKIALQGKAEFYVPA
jgi:hypothetical protein